MRKNFILVLMILSANAIAQTGGIVNKGKDIYVGENKTGTTPALYVNGKIQVETSGNFTQKGNTLVTGDFINNANSGNVFEATSSGTVEFGGTKSKQTIKGSADRAANYINFPNVKVNNSNAVSLEATMGASVNNLDLAKGRLVLESSINSSDVKLVNNAHLLVKNNITYNRTASNINDKGIIQVKLALGDNYTKGKVVGFTPPFKKIYNDYFFYNFVARPEGNDLFGSAKEFLVKPTEIQEAGKGYIIGQGIAGDDYNAYYKENWNDDWIGAKFAERATTELSFARDYGQPSFTQYIKESDAYSAEELNVKDVKITLIDGWNYLGNPFTTPLDLTDLIKESTAGDWGVTRGLNEGDNQDVRASIYLFTGGTGSYYPQNPKDKRFKLTGSYLVAQRVGNTIVLDNTTTVNSFTVAPMQMFLLGVYPKGKGKTFTIPASKRTHANVGFHRTATRSVEESLFDINDEFLLEVKDSKTLGYDRLAVVFRDGASLANNDPYDAPKRFNTSGGVTQIYTKALENRKQSTNVVNSDTKSLVMGVDPAHEDQEVTLTAHRLSSLSSVSKIVLEDTKTGTKTDLTQTPSYKFATSPTDTVKYRDRFVLHFTKNLTSIEDVDSSENLKMTASYDSNSGLLKVQGLATSDHGSSILVYDLQGRLIGKEQVSDVPKMEMNVQLAKGTYLVKISGKRTDSIKLLVN